MHIGIDAHALGARQGGNETYIRNLILALAQIDQENQYTLYFGEAEAARSWSGEFPNFKTRLIPRPAPIVRVPLALAFEIRRRPVDVLHVQYTAPPFCPVPVVTTIHDLAFEHFPETFTRRGSAQLKLTVRRTARKSAHILTVSEYSRQDILRTYGLPENQVTVTHNGCEAYLIPEQSGAPTPAAVMEKLGIKREYLLAVGSLQPRKNLIRLIQAFVQLRKKFPDQKPQLVIAGRKLWLYKDILASIAQQELSDDVIVTDYVTDEELRCLYKSAVALVYPSIFEGFGLPPLEAMACGTPVIASNTSSLPEVVGDAGILVDPYDIDSICDAMARILREVDLRSRLSLEGLRRAPAFSWQNAASRTLEVYRQVYSAKAGRTS